MTTRRQVAYRCKPADGSLGLPDIILLDSQGLHLFPAASRIACWFLYAAQLSKSRVVRRRRHCTLYTGTIPRTHGPVACLSLAVMVSVVLAVASALDHAYSDASSAKICEQAYAARMPFTGRSCPTCTRTWSHAFMSLQHHRAYAAHRQAHKRSVCQTHLVVRPHDAHRQEHLELRVHTAELVKDMCSAGRALHHAAAYTCCLSGQERSGMLALPPEC